MCVLFPYPTGSFVQQWVQSLSRQMSRTESAGTPEQCAAGMVADDEVYASEQGGVLQHAAARAARQDGKAGQGLRWVQLAEKLPGEAARLPAKKGSRRSLAAQQGRWPKEAGAGLATMAGPAVAEGEDGDRSSDGGASATLSSVNDDRMTNAMSTTQQAGDGHDEVSWDGYPWRLAFRHQCYVDIWGW